MNDKVYDENETIKWNLCQKFKYSKRKTSMKIYEKVMKIWYN